MPTFVIIIDFHGVQMYVVTDTHRAVYFL